MAFFQPPPIAKEHVDDESDSESEGEAEEIEGGESEDRKPLLAKRVRKVENNREMLAHNSTKHYKNVLFF